MKDPLFDHPLWKIYHADPGGTMQALILLVTAYS